MGGGTPVRASKSSEKGSTIHKDTSPRPSLLSRKRPAILRAHSFAKDFPVWCGPTWAHKVESRRGGHVKMKAGEFGEVPASSG